MGLGQFRVVQGEQETVCTVKPKHLLAAERKGWIAETAESGFRLAWLASESPLEFDAWIETVDDLEPVDQEQDADRPTKPGSPD